MTTNSTHGDFSGEPVTRWLTEAGVGDRKMKLLKAFSFEDLAGKRWTAEEDYVVDGASIPKALWSLVGSPFTGDYRRASIVHDRACNGADRATRRAADRMFYRACRAGHCSIREATVLYIGVRLGSFWAKSAPWRALHAAPERPTYLQSAEDDRFVADFRLICEDVVHRSELVGLDDPERLEASVDEAMARVTGVKYG